MTTFPTQKLQIAIIPVSRHKGSASSLPLQRPASYLSLPFPDGRSKSSIPSLSKHSEWLSPIKHSLPMLTSGSHQHTDCQVTRLRWRILGESCPSDCNVSLHSTCQPAAKTVLTRIAFISGRSGCRRCWERSPVAGKTETSHSLAISCLFL